MAKNGQRGKGRKGAVRGRVQVWNPKIKKWTKIDTKSTRKRFMDQKADGRPFKGVRKVG